MFEDNEWDEKKKRKKYGTANKKHLIWASLRFLLGRLLQTTLSIGYYIGFSVAFTTKPFFLTHFSQRSPKSEHHVLIGHLLITGPMLCSVACFSIPDLQYNALSGLEKGWWVVCFFFFYGSLLKRMPSVRPKNGQFSSSWDIAVIPKRCASAQKPFGQDFVARRRTQHVQYMIILQMPTTAPTTRSSNHDHHHLHQRQAVAAACAPF